MTTRVNKAKGFITLWNDYYETPSTHYETDKGADLYAVDGDTLMLKLYDDEFDVYKLSNEDKHTCYEIGVTELIRLIRENGRLATEREALK